MIHLGSTLIADNDYWTLWAIIISCASISIILEHKYKWANLISGAILGLLSAMLLSNLKIIPTESPVYDTVWKYIVPLAIPLLLFQANIIKIWKQSRRLLIIFLISALGTVIGVTLAYVLLNPFIPHLSKIGAMMTGSYIGGGVNFAALSGKFQAPSDLISSTIVADNTVMAFYFMILLALPNLPFIKKYFRSNDLENNHSKNEDYWKPKTIKLTDIAFAIGIAFIIAATSFKLSEILKNIFPEVPYLKFLEVFITDPYLLITTFTLVIVAVFNDLFDKLSGANEIGTFLIYIFFVVIGAPASLIIIINHTPLLFVFVIIILISNITTTLTLGKLFKFSIEEIVLASNATAGGPTTAAALAISKNWNSLVGPILIVGTLGYVIGNYIGTLIYHFLILIP
ncbi:DUF819 domain-containing protein [Staphylococcus massiliensis]|uniref:DUF819 family protein n=1 Tax=Staphylococcus massiliensis TaxID=555791 RepID=UPI001EDEA49B|nr:DUF819 family protein [Staphylococcus massiliensis]MCG3412377.1 DUF819 family protein [Staphylococcus massiliensis]